MRLKHKLLMFWIGTVVVSLAMVGVLFHFLISDLHEETSKKQVREAFGILGTQLDKRMDVLTRRVGLLARRRDVIASSSMISTYQNKNKYRPFIFDVEKKKLARELAKQAYATNLDLVAAYDSDLNLNSYFILDSKKAVKIGFVAYQKGKPVYFASDDAQSGYEASPPPPEILNSIVMHPSPNTPKAILRWVSRELALVVAMPVRRRAASGEFLLAGVIVAVDRLGEEFVRGVSHLAGMEFMYGANGGTRVGALQAVRLDAAPVKLPSLKEVKSSSFASWWLPHSDYYLGAARGDLADGGDVAFYFGLKREQLISEIAAFESAVLWVIAFAALSVIPFGLFFANRIITVPLEKLAQGVIELRDGRHKNLEGFDSQDELHDLAKSFNEMAGITLSREKELNELNTSLEARVKERTEELASANKELESFAYSVSHDLRAPLRSIDGFSHIVLSEYTELLDDRGKNYLNRVRGGVKRMGDLIDELLTLSRSTRGDMNRSRIDLSRIAHKTIQTLLESDSSRQVSFEVEPEVLGYGDPQLIAIVFDNLLGNAWKYTGKETQAEISFGSSELDGNGRIYFVKDNGAGFDMKYSEKLFAPFQRLHGVEEFEGNGVGLATALRIIARHGGRMWANAEVGKGATFFFTLKKEQ